MNPSFASGSPGQSQMPAAPPGVQLPPAPSLLPPGSGQGLSAVPSALVAPQVVPIPVVCAPLSLGTAPGVAPGVPETAPGVRIPPVPPAPGTTPSGPFHSAIRPYPPPALSGMNSYMSHPVTQQQPMLPPGVLATSSAGIPNRYTAPPFNPVARPPPFVPRPPLGHPPPVPMSSMAHPRPPGNGLRPPVPVLKPPPGVILSDLAAKGMVQLSAPSEKPHTTLYVGKIASTVEDDFLRSLLELCGLIKSWKRAQDPTTGSPKGFGFCEFESAEGVLRALRLLNKFALEGQELVLNVTQATREYLERYVAKKKEHDKLMREAEAKAKDEELAPGVENVERAKPLMPDKDGSAEKNENADVDGKKFGLVSESDKEADEAASQKLASMLEERARLKPLPPPPPLPLTGNLNKSVSPSASSLKDGDRTYDRAKSEDVSAKNDDDTGSDHKEVERSDITSTERGRRSERDRERDRERELEREKDREVDRHERERERERTRRERERDLRVRDAERIFEEREREWEARERDKERQRLYEREREKDRERERRREIKDQEEEDSDDDDWKKSRHRASIHDEKRKRRLREREEDEADKLREEQELAAMKRQKLEKVVVDAVKVDSEGDHEMNEEGNEEVPSLGSPLSPDITSVVVTGNIDSIQHREVEVVKSNGTHEVEQTVERPSPAKVASDSDLKTSPAPRKLGFGIIGSKRTTVSSVFHQEDEEEKTDERRLRPLVPIDYTAEEMEAVALPVSARSSSPAVASNLAAAAEFAKSLSTSKSMNSSAKDEKKDESDRRRRRDKPVGRDSSRKDRSKDRDRDRERDRDDRDRDRDWDRDRDKRDSERMEQVEKSKLPEQKKIKQLIDTIPKTKEELFAYPVDWTIYDQHDLQERMRPWISKKITEFLGEEETTLVDFIVSNTCKHVTASTMLSLLETILDDEAEMFVLKMWRMLIFEIRRVEIGLASIKPKS